MPQSEGCSQLTRYLAGIGAEIAGVFAGLSVPLLIQPEIQAKAIQFFNNNQISKALEFARYSRLLEQSEPGFIVGGLLSFISIVSRPYTRPGRWFEAFVVGVSLTLAPDIISNSINIGGLEFDNYIHTAIRLGISLIALAEIARLGSLLVYGIDDYYKEEYEKRNEKLETLSPNRDQPNPDIPGAVRDKLRRKPSADSKEPGFLSSFSQKKPPKFWFGAHSREIFSTRSVKIREGLAICWGSAGQPMDIHFDSDGFINPNSYHLDLQGASFNSDEISTIIRGLDNLLSSNPDRSSLDQAYEKLNKLIDEKRRKGE